MAQCPVHGDTTIPCQCDDGRKGDLVQLVPHKPRRDLASEIHVDPRSYLRNRPAWRHPYPGRR